MRVKNLNGSSLFAKPTCKCEDWLDHWSYNRGVRPAYCRACGKKTTDLVGGHVTKVSSYDLQRYIVPICRECNATRDKIFDVEEKDLVSANCSKCKNK